MEEKPATNQTGEFDKLWNSSNAFKFQVKLPLWTSPNKPSNTITNGEQQNIRNLTRPLGQITLTKRKKDGEYYQ